MKVKSILILSVLAVTSILIAGSFMSGRAGASNHEQLSHSDSISVPYNFQADKPEFCKEINRKFYNRFNFPIEFDISEVPLNLYSTITLTLTDTLPGESLEDTCAIIFKGPQFCTNTSKGYQPCMVGEVSISQSKSNTEEVYCSVTIPLHFTRVDSAKTRIGGGICIVLETLDPGRCRAFEGATFDMEIEKQQTSLVLVDKKPINSCPSSSCALPTK